MSDWQAIISLARRSLIVLAVALAIAAALYAGSGFFKNRMHAELAQVQQLQGASRASLAEKQSDLGNLHTEISRFSKLRQQGMVGVADRAGWAEELVASRQRTGLPDTLVYTLQTPKPLALQNGPATGAEVVAAPADSGTGGSTDPLFHDLDFELSNIHEDELLAFLQDYEANVKGRFRINACALSARTETGLLARCKLRFFTLPDTNPRPGPQ